MKKTILLFLLFFVQVSLYAQEYYPEGTRWTEIRLDTLKYNSWYSKVDGEWVPNFETIEYRVQGEYADEYEDIYKCVYTNGPEWTDSLTLLIKEEKYNDCVWASLLINYEDGYSWALCPAETYQFDWSVGKGLFYRDLNESNTTSEYPYYFYFGIINEIKEGDFGGVRPLKYVDLDGKAPYDPQNPGNIDTKGARIIQGIGVTEWNDGECLFGPIKPYFVLSALNPWFAQLLWENGERHYRSMLVHFVRNGEVLYDVWPKEGTTGINEMKNEELRMKNEGSIYDLSGRKVQTLSNPHGIYIENGQKKVR